MTFIINMFQNLYFLLKSKRIAFLATKADKRRPLAWLLDNKVMFESIYKIANQTEKQLLKSVNLFDV